METKNKLINNNNYDVVVIGAGNGGLIAATSCANYGLKTLLVEQHNLPGGFASSFSRGRFEFEVALHELGNFGNKHNKGDVFTLFEKLGIKCNWCEIDEAFRIIVKDKGYDFSLPFGIEKFAKKCDQYSPGCYKKVINFIQICKNCYDAVEYIRSTRGNPDPSIMKSKYANYLTCSVYTLEQVMKKMRIPKIVRFILGAYWTYLGITPKNVSMSLYAIMFYEYINFNAYIPRNRSHEISQTIASRFEELGGTIWYNTKAEKINVEHNHVVGVHTTRGYVKTNHIISNVSPHLVYSKMINKDNLPKIDNNITSIRKPGSQGFCIYLGLNKSHQELGLNNYSYFVYACDNHEEIYKKMNNIKTNDSYIVVVLNVANPNCSPKNTTILSFTTLFNDAWNDVNEDNYFEIKDELANRLITNFENQMNIKIKPYIEEIEIATPITFARYTKSANGAIYGYAPSVNDSAYIRARNMDKFYTIDGLRFCGGNGVTTHGYSITYISGDIIAGKTFSDIKKERSNER